MDHGSYYALGVEQLAEERFDLAIASFNEAIRLNPNNADAYDSRGDAYAGRGDSDLADADRAQAYFLRGVNDSSDSRKSITNLNSAIKLNPDHADAYYWRAQFFMLEGHTAQAWADLNKAVALDPDNARAHYLRGEIQSGNGNYDIAIDAYSRAIQLTADEPAGGYHIARGLAYGAKGFHDRAVADYSEVIRQSQDRDYYPYFVARARILGTWGCRTGCHGLR